MNVLHGNVESIPSYVTQQSVYCGSHLVLPNTSYRTVPTWKKNADNFKFVDIKFKAKVVFLASVSD